MFRLTSQFSVKREGFLFIDGPTLWLPGIRAPVLFQLWSAPVSHLSCFFLLEPTSKKKRADRVEVLGSKSNQSACPPAQLNGTWTSPVIYQSKEPAWSRSRAVCGSPLLVNYAPEPPNRCSLKRSQARPHRWPLASLASNESKVINVCDTATITIQCYSYSYSCSRRCRSRVHSGAVYK